MKDVLRNKRVLFALIMCFIVIAIAIVIFIIIGMDGRKSENVSVISLENSTVNSMTNVTNTTSDDEDNEDEDTNTANNTTLDDDEDSDEDEDEENDGENEIDFDGEQFYLDAVNDFVEGLTDEKKMEKFIDSHLDIKAYVAFYNVEGNDNEFLNEYSSLEDDDEKVQSVLEKLPEIATYDDVKLVALTDPKQSGDSEEINRVILTLKTDGKTEKLRMVFYGETVIYIYDNDNKSIIDLD